ncbi:uncharacterized protein LOC129599905 isoform X2 [Paramacrobiotus metropolitanus]|uniref:uncharacterized protein LOC129599905 isoform X2 n=1 Tax=Paramacrobiotus metropolitanus TaxID=2943436 RepID=UPI002445B0E4|nr:uncharacterized protein LOC129599905 isoform X2 [Paramacrobiotus metropolitanus]
MSAVLDGTIVLDDDSDVDEDVIFVDEIRSHSNKSHGKASDSQGTNKRKSSEVIPLSAVGAIRTKHPEGAEVITSSSQAACIQECLDSVTGNVHKKKVFSVARVSSPQTSIHRHEVEKSKMVKCPLCDESVPSISAVIFEICRHAFCRQCVSLDFRSRIRRKDLKRLTCLNENCATPADDAMISKLVDTATFNQYSDKISQLFLSENPLMVRCPNDTCGTPMELPRNDRPYEIRCVTCGYWFCSSCLHAQHNPLPCLFGKIMMLSAQEKKDVFDTFLAAQAAKEVVPGFHEQITVPENGTRFGFRRIFERCLDSNIATVEVDDPFIQSPFQIQRFVEFCSVVLRLAPGLRKICLRTRISPYFCRRETSN